MASWDSPSSLASYTVNLGESFTIPVFGNTSSQYTVYRIKASTSSNAIKLNGSSSWESSLFYGSVSFNFNITVTNTTAVNRAPITFIYEGTNNGITFYTIETRTPIVTVIEKTLPTYTAPTWASGLVYTGGNLQVFSDPGTVSGGTMYYGLGAGTSTEPTTWKEYYDDVVVQSAGEYFLWYKITGDSTHYDVAPQYLHRVDVAKADQTFDFTTPMAITVQEVASQAPSGNFAGTWSVTVIDQSVATASMVNNVLYVTGVSVGSTRIDITCSGNANYNSRTVQIFANVTLGGMVYLNGHWYKVKYSDSNANLHNVTNIVKYS